MEGFFNPDKFKEEFNPIIHTYKGKDGTEYSVHLIEFPEKTLRGMVLNYCLEKRMQKVRRVNRRIEIAPIIIYDEYVDMREENISFFEGGEYVIPEKEAYKYEGNLLGE